MPPARELISVRLSPAGLEAIDWYAEREGRNRSEMIRRLLAEAIAARQHRAGLK